MQPSLELSDPHALASPSDQTPSVWVDIRQPPPSDASANASDQRRLTNQSESVGREVSVPQKAFHKFVSMSILLAHNLNPMHALKPPARIETTFRREKRRTARLIQGTASILAGLRVIVFALWITLIGLYFSYINSQFPRVECQPQASFIPIGHKSSIRYCSRSYLLFSAPGQCAISTISVCSVNVWESIPVLLYLTVAQSVIFLLRTVPSSKTEHFLKKVLHGPGVLSRLRALGAFLCFVAAPETFIFSLFILEGFALPFGTKDNVIAFSEFDSYGLHITCLISTALCVLGFLMVRRNSRFNLHNPDFSDSLFTKTVTFAFGLSILAVAIHSIVSASIYALDNVEFITPSIFFSLQIDLSFDFSAYQVVRTLFSIGAILENVFTFALFNMLHRMGSDQFLENYATKSAYSILMGPIFLLHKSAPKPTATVAATTSMAAALVTLAPPPTLLPETIEKPVAIQE